MTTYEMAEMYYPKLWDEVRLRNLVARNKISASDYEKLVGEAYNLSDNQTNSTASGDINLLDIEKIPANDHND